MNLVDEQLQSYDVSKLKPFDQMLYAHLIQHKSKVEALKMIINYEVGNDGSLDYQLSNIAKEYYKYEFGGNIDNPEVYKDENPTRYTITEVQKHIVDINDKFGEIGVDKLKNLLGYHPKQNEFVVGNLKLKKIFLRPYYKVV